MVLKLLRLKFPKGENYGNASFEVMLYEFKDGLNKYLAASGGNSAVKNLKELIEFNKRDTVELKYFDQKLLEMAEKKEQSGIT